MNRVKEIERINAKDVALQLRSDTVGDAGRWSVDKSWHAQYKNSSYCYVGGLPYELSEGDVIVIFSQFGEVVDVNMPRDPKTGKPRGFAFIAYEDQRSTVLACDNFNGAKVLGKTLRCDHSRSYHEEQAKDPENIPDHVAKRLSEKELNEKKAQIVRRNAELEEAAEKKGELFAHGRGTAVETPEEEEARIRRRIMTDKDAEAAEKQAGRIAAVMARRKADAMAAMGEEARKEELRLQKRKERDEEFRLIATQSENRAGPGRDQPRAAGAHPDAQAGRARERDKIFGSDRDFYRSAPGTHAASMTESGPQVSDAKWERFMDGSKKKKKKEKRPAAPAAEPDDGERGGGGGLEASVEETNRMRASLGLAPLR